jgi:hypothetical protein
MSRLYRKLQAVKLSSTLCKSLAGCAKTRLIQKTSMKFLRAVAGIISGCSKRPSSKVRDARNNERQVCTQARSSRRAE